MRLGDPARDGQTEAGPAGLAAGGVAAIEPLEHARQLLRRNADSRVGDDHTRAAVVGRDVERHAPARGSELHGVVEHDHEELADQGGVAGDARFLEPADRDGDALLLRERAHRFHGFRGDVVEIHLFPRDSTLARIGPRQREQVTDDLAEARGLPLDGPERRGVPRGVAVLAERDLGAGAQQGDRRPQLVRGVGHEAAHLFHGALHRGHGLPHQQVAAAGDEQQGREGGRGEGPDQGCVLVFQLHAVGNRRGDVPGAGRSREALGVEPQRVMVRGLDVPVRAARRRRLAGRIRDPGRRRRGLDRPSRRVEEVQGAPRHVQLVHRVHDGPARVRLLLLADARRPLQGRRRGRE